MDKIFKIKKKKKQAGRYSSGLYKKRIILQYWIMDACWSSIFLGGAFPFLLVISWGSPSPNSGDPNVSPMAKVREQVEKSPRIPCGRGGDWGKGVSGLLVSLKFKIWVGGLRLGEGERIPRVSVLCALVCMSECLFAPVCMSLKREREHVCFSLNVSSGSGYLLLSECHRVSVCLHQCLCQFRDGACLFQSDCQFREIACLLQSECQS